MMHRKLPYTIPERFIYDVEGTGHFIVHPRWLSSLKNAVQNRELLRPFPGGRGSSFLLEEQAGTAHLRFYRRGGWIARFLSDAFLLHNRPYKEFMVHYEAQRRGIPVPNVWGVWWEQKGPWIRGALLTEFLPWENLLRYAKNHSEEACRQAFYQSGKVVGQAVSAGLFHADLHPGNLLISGDAVKIIDLDRARFIRFLADLHAQSMLRRFRRALRKHDLPESLYAAFLQGYTSSG